MLNRFALITFVGVVALATCLAQQPTVNLPVGKTSPNDGKEMFNGYCAPCHGVDGKGVGPVTSQLIQKPVDLTVLEKNNGGKFPSAHVVAIIEFGPDVPAAHGTKDMPIWGPILRGMDRSGHRQDIQALRTRNLETYIRTLQVK